MGMGWDLVFCQPDGRPVGHERDHADGKALLADAGVRDARLHDARHTAASLLLLLKVTARVVMEMLGHSSCRLTMNTHSHVARELDSEAAQLMAGAL
jgi:integrase